MSRERRDEAAIDGRLCLRSRPGFSRQAVEHGLRSSPVHTRVSNVRPTLPRRWHDGEGRLIHDCSRRHCRGESLPHGAERGLRQLHRADAARSCPLPMPGRESIASSTRSQRPCSQNATSRSRPVPGHRGCGPPVTRLPWPRACSWSARSRSASRCARATHASLRWSRSRLVRCHGLDPGLSEPMPDLATTRARSPL